MVEIRINDDSKDSVFVDGKSIPRDDAVILARAKKPTTKKTIVITETKQQPEENKAIIVAQPNQVKKTIVIKEKKPRKAKKPRKPPVLSKTMGEMIAVMKANQQLVDEMIKVNTGIMENMVRLSSGVALLTEKMNSFISRERNEELPSTVRDEMENKLDQMERKLNNIITSLSHHQ
ncbi:MAG: hypothetical protein V1870_01820 [Candidatus Aenigmatarchaeota archaeon]